MTKSILFVTGLIISCVVCAGMPAVAAAENPREQVTMPAPQPVETQAGTQVVPAASQKTAGATPVSPVLPATTREPVPWYAPLGAWLGCSGNSDTPASAVQDADKPWWEQFLPGQQKTTAVQQADPVTPIEQKAVTDNAQVPAVPGKDMHSEQQNSISKNAGLENPKTPRNQ